MNSEVVAGPVRVALERSARARLGDGSLSKPEPLSHFSEASAWVLMADPGSGKSDAFETLARQEGGHCVSARNFCAMDLPELWTPPLFIDGLDEMAGGGAVGATALDLIRGKLQKLGVPKFRISCREADWRGSADNKALQYLVGDGNFLELHLEPLSHKQIVALVMHWQGSDEASATDFVREAKRHDLEGLLDNPQTLRMLVKAVVATANAWPTSKTETYENACAHLVLEHNDQHRAAQRNCALADGDLLQAAGYLCAVMLLSGSAAIALQRHAEPGTGTFSLPELVKSDFAPDLSNCRAALHTRVFRGVGDGDFAPVHRTIAEYLGAHYLASRIDSGLPASRVLALMRGNDAGVVPEMRGLHAWLAATAPGELRRELIERDPLGVVLNGDVRNFTRSEKLHVLNALRDEATRYAYFRSQNWVSHPFGALATADMEGDFKALLQSADRSSPHQALLDCVLDALAHGQAMLDLRPELERVVRDKTYWVNLRTEALRGLIACARNDNDWLALTHLLVAVGSSVVEDLDDELLGLLLSVLYPRYISSAEVWRYFRQPSHDQTLGTYFQFWAELPSVGAPVHEVPALLDALLVAGHQLDDQYDYLGLSRIVGELLLRGVTEASEPIEIERLYRWLSLGLGPDHDCGLEQEDKAALGRWLIENPSVYRALFEYGLAMPAQVNEDALGRIQRVRACLYDAQVPDDAWQWYLSLAEATEDDDLRRQLLGEAADAAEQKSGPNGAILLLERWSKDHTNDSDWVTNRLQCDYPRSPPYPGYVDSQIRYKEHREREAERSRERTEFFRRVLPNFDPGPAHLGALVEVANAYLNFSQRSSERTPDARLLALLSQNEEWVRLALHGLRQCLFRDDLPSVANIIDLHIQSRRYHLAAPCLAAMELRYADNPATALDLPLATLEVVAAFRLTNDYGETPKWFRQLLAQHPAVLASVMHRLISQQIATKIEHIQCLYRLARDPDYATVAKQTTPQLITAFPRKAGDKQLKNLRLLIVAGLANLGRDTQLALIATKLSATRMNVAQRAYWLTAGVLLAPELYLDRIGQFAKKSQVRAGHVFALIHERGGRGGLRAGLPAKTQAFLIALLGPRSSLRESLAGGFRRVTSEMEMGEFVADLISSLAGNPDEVAAQALLTLQQRPDMKHWADSLSRALYDQRITRRKALFKPASVSQVCATLANLKPANAADLWALTVDHLQQLASEIRNGNTNDYRQYWAGEQPRLEDDCRDALLSDLKKHLNPLGVAAEPEGRYADEKRADIKVIAARYHFPIEIKCEWHPQLWKAVREQLIAKYGRETSSDGYGIYLVFWFGGQRMPVAGDGGTKPKTPKELQQRLAATVPPELRDKIAVLVVDCEKPITPSSVKKHKRKVA